MIAWPAVGSKYVRFIGTGEGVAGWGESMSGSSLVAPGRLAAGQGRGAGCGSGVACSRPCGVEGKPRRGRALSRPGQPCPVRRYRVRPGLARGLPAGFPGPRSRPSSARQLALEDQAMSPGLWGAYVHPRQANKQRARRAEAKEGPRMPPEAFSGVPTVKSTFAPERPSWATPGAFSTGGWLGDLGNFGKKRPGHISGSGP